MVRAPGSRGCRGVEGSRVWQCRTASRGGLGAARGQQADQVVVAGRRRRGRPAWRTARARHGVATGVNCSRTERSAALAATADRDGVQLVVGAPAPRRRRPAGAPPGSAGWRPHRGEVLPGQGGRRPPRRPAVHGGDHITCVAHRAQVEGGHQGRAARARHDQAYLSEPQQRLADRRTADPEPVGELEVAQLLARREGAVDDGVPEPGEHLVAQQCPRDRGCRSRNGHAIYCMSRRVARQCPCPPPRLRS